MKIDLKFVWIEVRGYYLSTDEARERIFRTGQVNKSPLNFLDFQITELRIWT